MIPIINFSKIVSHLTIAHKVREQNKRLSASVRLSARKGINNLLKREFGSIALMLNVESIKKL